MALVNAYVEVEDVESHLSSMKEGKPGNRELLERAINSASRSIDQHCRRNFYVDSATSSRVFRPEGWDLVYVDDIATTTGLVVETDTSDNGTFDTTWATTDYELDPPNGISSSGEAWPFTAIKAVDSRRFPYGRRSTVRVTATWGWAAAPPSIEQACLLLAARIYRRRQSPEGVIGFGEFGAVRLTRQDADVADLLMPYKKVGVLR